MGPKNNNGVIGINNCNNVFIMINSNNSNDNNDIDNDIDNNINNNNNNNNNNNKNNIWC